MAGTGDTAKTGKIADVVNWKNENDHVVIDFEAGHDIELKINKDKTIKIVVSKQQGDKTTLTMDKDSNGTNLKIVVSQLKGDKTPPGDSLSQNSKQTDEKTDPSAQKESQVDNSSQQKKGSNDGEGNKRSDNALGNVMNLLKDYKGIVITAVIAISLGILLRRKFKVV